MLLIGLMFCIFGSMIQSNTFSTLLPYAAKEIGGTEYYSLASTVTGVVSIVLMPLYGYLGARMPEIKRPLIAALVGLIILIVAMKKRGGEAIIPTTALKNRNVIALTLANFFGMASTMALFFFLPSYIINVMDGMPVAIGFSAFFAVCYLLLRPRAEET